MPLLDMPIEKLKDYQGTNPCPQDFDKYWQDGLNEVKAIDPNIKLKPANVTLNGFEAHDLYFKSVKQSTIHAQYVLPADKSKKYPVLLLFHGYGGHSGNFLDKVAFAGQGYIVLAMDCRGQRGLSENRVAVSGTEQNGLIMRGIDDPDPTNLYFRNVYLDTVQLVRVAKSLPNADINNIYAYGGSQGGGLTVACAALNGNDIKKIAAVHPFLCDYKRVWSMDLAEGAYSDIQDYLKNYAPLLDEQEHVWQKLGYIDIQHMAKWISADVMWATGLMDNICPPSTQFAAYNKIRSKKDIVLYTNHKHEGLPGFSDKFISFFNKR